MLIRHLAHATGMNMETIRFYEKQDLLPAPARQSNEYRDYTAGHLQPLLFKREKYSADTVQ